MLTLEQAEKIAKTMKIMTIEELVMTIKQLQLDSWIDGYDKCYESVKKVLKDGKEMPNAPKA